MQAIKVDIKRELIDMPNNRPMYVVPDLPSMSARMAREGEMSVHTNMVGTETTYLVRKVYNPHSKTPNKHYLVKSDDNEIFTELLEVSNGLITERVKRESQVLVDEAVIDGIKVGVSRGKREVWAMPWYKRLFNKDK